MVERFNGVHLPALSHISQNAHSLQVCGSSAFELLHDLLLLVCRNHEVPAVALVADNLHAGDGLVLALLDHKFHLGLILAQGLHAGIDCFKQARPAHVTQPLVACMWESRKQYQPKKPRSPVGTQPAAMQAAEDGCKAKVQKCASSEDSDICHGLG